MADAPNWGYVIQGKLTTTYDDGTSEVSSTNDLFYWPPGHTVKVKEDAEFILFSPQHEHTRVLDHMIAEIN